MLEPYKRASGAQKFVTPFDVKNLRQQCKARSPSYSTAELLHI